MDVSKRLAGINGADDDDGWGIFYRAREMVRNGQNVTELTIGEHDIRTDPRILEAMNASAVGGHTGYARVPGVRALREKIAARVESQTGVPTTRDNVVVTAGGQAALFAAHVATCDPGDRALFIDPYYATYPGTIRAASAVPVPVRTHSRNGFQPTAADIDAEADGARALLVNSPNNPTGGVYSLETIDGICEVAHNRNLWLITDEVYDTQVWHGEHISPRSRPDMVERTMVIGSMSKSHAMTGSRCGWIVAPEPVIEDIIALSTNTNYGVAGFVQDAALFALNLGPEFEEQIAEPFHRRRDKALELIASQNVVRAIPPDGAMYAMLDIRATGLSGEAFAERLLDQHQIAVMPGESFGVAAAGHLRVALTVDDDRLMAALNTILDMAAGLAD